MNQLETWGDVFTKSFQDAWLAVANFLPAIVAAILILVIGWIIAAALGRLVARLLKFSWIDQGLEKIGLVAAFAKAGVELKFSALVGWLVKWFLVVVVLIATADALGLSDITSFLNRVVLYLPNVIVAVVILIIGITVANFVRDVIMRAVNQLSSQATIAGIAKWAIVVFSFMAALVQLGVAADLITTLFTGFVAMLALAGGLAFGLGGKQEAERIVKNLRQDISKNGN